MKITIKEALLKGVEAHKSGKIQEADQYYTAILQSQPKHSDANHNMGVLAVGLGKVEEALPYFETALESTAMMEQYWLSYADALIKLKRLDEAKALLKRAQDQGITGTGLKNLEEKLGSSEIGKEEVQDPPQVELGPLVDLYTKGKLEEAIGSVHRLLEKYPRSTAVYNVKGAIEMALKNYEQAIKSYQAAIQIDRFFAKAHMNLGLALSELNKIDNAG